jgi:hypothetical protein
MGEPVMHRSVIASIAAAACVLISLGAAADESSDANGKMLASAGTFAALDRNGDRRISRSEAGFDRVMSHTFAEIDTDGDGFVSTTEYAAAEKTRTTVSNLTHR